MRPLTGARRNAIIAVGVVLAGVVLALLVGVGSSSSGDGLADQRFLNLTAYDDTLRLAIPADRITLGHAMCSMLGKYHGDAQQAETAVADGHESTFTPAVLEDLRFDATSAYCPKYR